MTITATLVRRIEHWTGDARLYKLSEPVPCWDDKTTEYVVVSATTAPFGGPETYVFAADAEGKVTDWSEMSGSFRGGLNHGEAIRNSGWVEEDMPVRRDNKESR